MRNFFKSRWVLFLILIIFIICKIPHLGYAYYWDESWPYAMAIKEMYTHGISLVPDAIDPELSRGHPLFFHAAAAAWMKIFGASHVAMHSFALCISLLFLTTIFEAGVRLFDRNVAVLSTVMVALQVMFFVQSSFVLFDMLVAFLAFLSLYLYAKEMFAATAICLSVLFYTKESGLIAGFVIGVHALASLTDRKTSMGVRLKRLASIAMPCILIGIFFLLQKYIHGWFIFPLYNDLIEHKWEMFWYRFKVLSAANTFSLHMRHYYFLPLLTMAVLTVAKTKNYRHLIVFFPALAIYYCTDDMRSGRIMPGVPFFIVLIFSIIALLYVTIKERYYASLHQQRFMILLCSFVFCFLVFSSMNFFTPRYLLASVIPVLFINAVLVSMYIALTDKRLVYPVFIMILIIGFFSFKTNVGFGDVDLGAFDGVQVEQKIVDYFEHNVPYEKVIGCSFLDKEHLLHPATGFLHSEKGFNNTSWYINDKTDYAVFTNIEPDDRYGQVKSDPSFILAYRCQKGEVWGEVYKKIRQSE